MAGANRAYLVAAGLAVAAAVAMGQGVRDRDRDVHYRDYGGPSALWHIPDGRALVSSPPVRVRIPDIGVDAPVMRLGLNDDGTVEVPPFDKGGHTGWYENGPTPGARGGAVMLGHYDDRDGRAVFYRLHELEPGARIRVARRDGQVAEFTVDAVERVHKWEFPRKRVYGRVDYAGLRLVTCGGEYDERDHSYQDNVIVYAHLTSGQPRPSSQARP